MLPFFDNSDSIEGEETNDGEYLRFFETKAMCGLNQEKGCLAPGNRLWPEWLDSLNQGNTGTGGVADKTVTNFTDAFVFSQHSRYGCKAGVGAHFYADDDVKKMMSCIGGTGSTPDCNGEAYYLVKNKFFEENKLRTFVCENSYPSGLLSSDSTTLFTIVIRMVPNLINFRQKIQSKMMNLMRY